MEKKTDIKHFGQIFTPINIAKKMVSLRCNLGRTIEPSAGEGVFLEFLGDDTVAIELSDKLSADNILNMDFFDYPKGEKFACVIGNPPYVRHQDILSSTKKKLSLDLFDGRSNLYLFFIEKALRHLDDGGELIFITPRDFLKLTSAAALNQMLYEQGSFTDFIDLGDKKIFENAMPNCAIWRWQKGRKSKKLNDGREFCISNGQIWFGTRQKGIVGDVFSVKVGAVSGADKIFSNREKGCTDFVCSTTAQTGAVRRMIYNRYDTCLDRHKDTLMNRKIKAFGAHNWWQWGRNYPVNNLPRIYVNCKTRNRKPFFIHECKAFDGSILALFPKADVDITAQCKKLNTINWQELGFICDGRYIFTQRSLENAPFE